MGFFHRICHTTSRRMRLSVLRLTSNMVQIPLGAAFTVVRYSHLSDYKDPTARLGCRRQDAVKHLWVIGNQLLQGVLALIGRLPQHCGLTKRV